MRRLTAVCGFYSSEKQKQRLLTICGKFCDLSEFITENIRIVLH